MKTSEDIYEELRKKYTDQEIAEGFIFDKLHEAGKVKKPLEIRA